VTELNDYVDAGGATLIDCTSIEIGRDPSKLRTVSERTGLKIVMGTSHYRHPYLDRDWFDRHDVDSIAEGHIRDIRDGVGDTGIRAGIIGEAASERDFIPTLEANGFTEADVRRLVVDNPRRALLGEQGE
jgi:predicted metal-dependent phosphotriesterase family hydrolase